MKERQAAADAGVYPAARQMARECPEVKMSIGRHQLLAEFAPEEVEPLMVQRYWWKTIPTLSIICYGILG